MAVNRYYSAVAQDTTITSGISSSSTTVAVGSVTGFPSVPFVVALDYNNSLEELVTVTNVSGLTLTISRANAGLGSGTVGTAVAHGAGATVRHVITAQDLTEAQAHIAATGSIHGVTGALASASSVTTVSSNLATHTGATGAVHGVTGAVVGTTDTQTLTNKDLTSGTNTFPTSLATLTGSQTLTNKDLTSSTNSFPSNLGNTFTVNAQTGTTYTLVGSDANKLVTATNSGSTITVTIPAGVFSVGQSVNITQLGAAQVIFQGDGTSTVYSTPGVKLRAQYSVASVACIATNTFLLIGDLTA
jgi:hypothetical protein